MKLATTTLVFCVAALLALGMVILYSASVSERGAHYLTTQLVWCALGLTGCGLVASLDYRVFKKLAIPLLIFAVALLMLVLIPHVPSYRINGARRWLGLPQFSTKFQPSELAKVALIIALAWYGDRYQRHMGTWKKGVMIPGFFMALVLGLIFIEPDRGTTILMGAVLGAMLLVAGVRWKHLVPPVIVALVGLVISLMTDPMRRERILGWLQPDAHKDVSYQAEHAMLALGAGGWTGLGLGNSRQKLGFLPEHTTDFIFSIIGEELGLIGTLLVIAGFLFVVISGTYIASHSSDTFGLLLGSGISFLIGLQAFINIGVVTGSLPNKGLALPFISYGGSNLLMMLTSIGFLLSIARKARPGPEEADEALEPGTVPSPQTS